MPDVNALQDAVRALTPRELEEFQRWFAEFDSARWESQIDVDLSSGKLDAFLAEAQTDFHNRLGL